MLRTLMIIGNGGHTQDILGIIELGYSSTSYYSTIVIIDDDSDKSEIKGTSIEDMYLKYKSKHSHPLTYVIGVNDSQVRAKIAARMDSLYAKPAEPIVHSSAVVMSRSGIGDGSIIGPNAVITRNVKLGQHSHLNSCASINQGSQLGDFITMAPGARICGDVNVGDRVGFGCNASVINMINIGSDVFVGAGAVVIRDIPDGQTVVGVPAKQLIKDK